MKKTIRTVSVYDELPEGQSIRVPLGSDVVSARRCTDTGVLQLVVIHGVTATIPMTIAVHVVPDDTGFLPARGKYIATVDGPSRPVHVFLGPHRP
ncbi:hypothetical protein [Rhodococcus sp. NPDC003348]